MHRLLQPNYNETERGGEVKKEKYIKALQEMWDNSLAEFDNIMVGPGHNLKQGDTCLFKRKDANARFFGTIFFSNSKCAYIVVSNYGANLCISYLKDLIQEGNPIPWQEFYGSENEEHSK